MVGANGGGTFLIPWLIFLFAWSIPLVIAEYAMGKRSRTGTIGTFRILVVKNYGWSLDSRISTAIGFNMRLWLVDSQALHLTDWWFIGDVDTNEVWNAFLKSSGQVIFYQFLVVPYPRNNWIWSKNDERSTLLDDISSFCSSRTVHAFSWISRMVLRRCFVHVQRQSQYVAEPSVWINALSQSVWSCSGVWYGNYHSVYMRKDEDVALNSSSWVLQITPFNHRWFNCSVCYICCIQMTRFGTVTGGSSVITFLALPEVFAHQVEKLVLSS